jgi:hypothetical protein
MDCPCPVIRQHAAHSPRHKKVSLGEVGPGTFLPEMTLARGVGGWV